MIHGFVMTMFDIHQLDGKGPVATLKAKFVEDPSQCNDVIFLSETDVVEELSRNDKMF